MYYNLIVSGREDQWERSNTPFLSSRILEYTHTYIEDIFLKDGRLSKKVADYPALLMCESPRGVCAKVAKILDVKEGGEDTVIQFEVIPDLEFSNDVFEERAFQFAIDSFEFHRTHWSIKDVDLIATLERLNLLHDGQLASLNRAFPHLAPPDESDQGEFSKIKVFISYSHADRLFLDRIRVHLKPLERKLELEIWDDTKLTGGDEWKIEIRNNLETCAAAILIVSADFLASDFIVTQELPPLLKAAKERGARIIPIIVKPCLFNEMDELTKFQAVNSPANTLSGMTETESEQTYVRLASTVKTLIPD